MSYTSGTNYRTIKSFSGGRGLVSNMKTRTAGAGGSGPSVNSPNSGNSGTGNTSSNSALTAQLKTYSKIAQDGASKVQDSGAELTKVGENSLFDKAEKSGNNKPVISEVTDFVNNYNNMISGITKLGGKENKDYIAKLQGFAEANKDALKEVGITVLKDGSLTMNKKELEGASLEKLKKLFNGEDSFADKVTDLSKDIEANVEKKLKENLLILGGHTSNIKNGKSGNFLDMSV